MGLGPVTDAVTFIELVEVTCAVAVAEQPLALVTVTVYKPAASPVAVAVV